MALLGRDRLSDDNKQLSHCPWFAEAVIFTTEGATFWHLTVLVMMNLTCIREAVKVSLYLGNGRGSHKSQSVSKSSGSGATW